MIKCEGREISMRGSLLTLETEATVIFRNLYKKLRELRGDNDAFESMAMIWQLAVANDEELEAMVAETMVEEREV